MMVEKDDGGDVERDDGDHVERYDRGGGGDGGSVEDCCALSPGW